MEILDYLLNFDKNIANLMLVALIIFSVLYIFFLFYKDSNPILSKIKKSHLIFLIISIVLIFTLPTYLYGSHSDTDFRLSQGAPFKFDFSKFVINSSSGIIYTLIAFGVIYMMVGFSTNTKLISKDTSNTLFKSLSLIALAVLIYVLASTINASEITGTMEAMTILIVFAFVLYSIYNFMSD